ncbi:MAG TPA: class I SAM-dependent methyltransferase [Blastocatellia bacterium]|nr:class I SAM-dependent methyltransferase [Blastocatellia bacterium]
MREDEYRAMYDLEDRMWWYVGMREITAALLDVEMAGGAGLRVLDVGCGTGYALNWLRRRYAVERAYGVDLSPHAAALWRLRDLDTVALASGDRLPFGEGEFDLITCFDVIYQLDDEAARRAVSEMYRALKPGGVLFIREPAYEWMRGGHDVAVATRHRYTRAELKRLLESVGFAPRRATYANALLFWAAVPHRLWSRLKGSGESDVKPTSPLMNRIFGGALNVESKLVRRMAFPFGLSVIVVARKPA